jgi:superfamily II DNA or RNA helicase
MTAFRELEYHLEIYTDSKEVKFQIDNLLSAYEENYENIPRYQSGAWDGKKRFYKTRVSGSGVFFNIPKGFKQRLLNNVEFDDVSVLPKPERDYLGFLRKVLPELPFKPYKHQLKAFIGMLEDHNHLAIVPTGGGKSLIAYLLIRYFWENNKKSILVVPTIGLTSQMMQDFKQYNAPEEMMQDIKLIGGENKDKSLDNKIIISTWQSLAKSIKNIKEYDTILVDEAHQLKADILSDILSQPVKNKIGMTGSFPIIDSSAMSLIQVLGEPCRYITAKELMKMNLLTDTTIMAMFLNYSRKMTKGMSNAKYHDEVKFIRENPYRSKFIKTLLQRLKGVTVALYSTTEHGENTFFNLTGIKLTAKKKSDFEL